MTTFVTTRAKDYRAMFETAELGIKEYVDKAVAFLDKHTPYQSHLFVELTNDGSVQVIGFKPAGAFDDHGPDFVRVEQYEDVYAPVSSRKLVSRDFEGLVSSIPGYLALHNVATNSHGEPVHALSMMRTSKRCIMEFEQPLSELVVTREWKRAGDIVQAVAKVSPYTWDLPTPARTHTINRVTFVGADHETKDAQHG